MAYLGENLLLHSLTIQSIPSVMLNIMNTESSTYEL